MHERNGNSGGWEEEIDSRQGREIKGGEMGEGEGGEREEKVKKAICEEMEEKY